MTVTFASFLEKAESVSPSSAGFALNSGRAGMSLYLANPSFTDMQDAVTQLLGDVSELGGPDPGLTRQLPMAHPLYPWLYASNIADIRGMGTPVQNVALPPLEAPPLTNFLGYPYYEFRVDFTPRPYVVASDASVQISTLKFFDDAGNQQSSDYAPEWLRYTDWETHPQYDSITADLGLLSRFRTQGNVKPGDGTQFCGKPRVFLPNQLLKIYWYQVPYRYVTSKNSFISNLPGRINQNDFSTWKAGSLLYLGFNARRYTPPIQALDGFYTGTTGLIYSAAKWCDVEFTFLLTTRKSQDTPQGTLVPGRPELQDANRNWVAAGHNLQPWLTDRKFHYVTSEDATNVSDTTKWYPYWLSVPFELLFSDPDDPGVYQLTGYP